MLDTRDGGEDDADDQWKVEGYDELYKKVHDIDYNLSLNGYKTLGVSLKVADKPWVFVGILPQMDPPRVDTEVTINALKNAGVRVKMITGDHLNIAKETARKIGLGTDAKKQKIPNILAGQIVREKAGSEEIKELCQQADGFAQVMPSDKREVVEILIKCGEVVGFTGDGVNDAPALSRAQCGVANAAAMILTSEGLSAVYSAVVESRRIFKKLKAYVVYRFAASIQIVSVLAVLVLAVNCSIKPLFIILLALFNDITMLPIAYDYQQAAKDPENADVTRMLTTSAVLGLLETAFSLIFAFNAAYDNGTLDDIKVQAAIFIQMFVAAELLIFSTRAPSYFFDSHLPSAALVFGVFSGLVIITGMVLGLNSFGKLNFDDVLVIYAYDILVFIFVDWCKMRLYNFFNEDTAVLPDTDVIGDELARLGVTRDDQDDAESGVAMKDAAADETRMSIAGERMTAWSIANEIKENKLDPSEARQSLIDRKMRASLASSRLSQASGSSRFIDMNKMTAGVAHDVHSSNDKTGDRPSLLGGSIRPNTPAALYASRQ
eukprot:GSChrysophyteH1.ASY1.ANO1.2990.1 assembled CDS